MILKPPFMITARLLPGVKVGDATISIEPRGHSRDGRIKWRVYIDHKDWTHDDSSMKSGVGDHGMKSIQDGMKSYLSFLSACAESRRYATWRHKDPMKGENSDLFPPHVGEWAEQFSDEITMLELEIEETPDLVMEGE